MIGLTILNCWRLIFVSTSVHEPKCSIILGIVKFKLLWSYRLHERTNNQDGGICRRVSLWYWYICFINTWITLAGFCYIHQLILHFHILLIARIQICGFVYYLHIYKKKTTCRYMIFYFISCVYFAGCGHGNCIRSCGCVGKNTYHHWNTWGNYYFAKYSAYCWVCSQRKIAFFAFGEFINYVFIKQNSR